MYLKSVEMYGFKSFAKKMVFKFDGGITGIVGPNGSGKSNIADAIRWVLGEQSAKNLRGGKMQDIIFAGTENRKPLGFCQVDLTIDNQDLKMPIDYTEVTVSRRVYRSGESEFYINQTACRLKDIHELFMDTGVGKEGYSIIGQGQIDKILSTKPDDRRALFDEAAGIVKYKSRKKNAEKKLEQEHQNLLRINDIIRELEERQDVLEGQAKIAKEYLEYKEGLKKYEINVFIIETERLQEDIQKFVDKESIVNGNIEAVHQKVEDIKNKHQELNRLLEDLEKQGEEEKTAFTELQVKKEKSEGNIELLRVEIQNLEDNNKRIEEQKSELISKSEKSNDLMESYQKELDDLTNTYNSQNNMVKGQQEKYESLIGKIQKDENEINNIKTNIIERLNEISGVKSKIQRHHAMVENIVSRKDVVETRLAIFKGTIKNVNREAEKSQDYLDQLLMQKDSLLERKEELNADSKKNNQNRYEIEREYKTKSFELSNLKSKHKALTDLAEHYEGYNFSIKKIMEYKKARSEKSILGVVADIIEVQKEYELAIETALGGSIQNIVVKDEQVAKKMINYLKENRFGRATFLPLTTVKGRSVNRKVTKGDRGFIGYGSDLVDTEVMYDDIISSLLGAVVVVDTIDNGLQIARKYNYSLRIVTKAGELINPGGSLTGGAYKKQGNQFLARRREVEGYKDLIVNLSVQVSGLEAKITKITSTNEALDAEIKKLTDKENQMNLMVNSVALQLKQFETDLAKEKEEAQQFEQELIELNKQKNELDQLIGDLEGSLGNTESLNSEAEDSVMEITSSIEDNKQERDQLANSLTEVKVELSSLQQQIQNVQQNIKRMNEEASEFFSLKARYESEIKINTENSENKKAQIEELHEQLALMEKEVEEKGGFIKELSEKRHSIGKEQEGLYKEREEQSEQLNLLDKELLRIQNAKYKLETGREVARDHIWNEYEITFNTAKPYRDESLGSLTTIRKEITTLKSKIKGLGDVNVNSIEEYRTVSERYEFLSTQRDDIVEATEKLKDVIEDLVKRMEKQFREKFKEITVKFDEVFKELFGGGRGILRLTESDVVLESGIEIVAQPPGKKLQSMMLLSGGEKAFTAIALLFAIQSLKPSPFCVLDEIEAALDDANVVRFASYLNNLTHNTQFIIITHRRGTMEACDALYGITMQEKGVSTQVSVKLLEKDLVE